MAKKQTLYFRYFSMIFDDMFGMETNFKFVISEYKILFYYRNNLIKKILKDLGDFINLDICKNVENGDEILTAEKKTISYILSMNYKKLRSFLKTWKDKIFYFIYKIFYI